MTITELIEHLTLIAKKNPNLVMYGKSIENDFEEIDSKFFQIGHIKRDRNYGDVINACKIEEASDFLIQ